MHWNDWMSVDPNFITLNKFLTTPSTLPINHHVTELTRNVFNNLWLAAIGSRTMLYMDEATVQVEFACSGSFNGVKHSKLDGYDLDIRQIFHTARVSIGFTFSASWASVLIQNPVCQPLNSHQTFTTASYPLAGLCGHISARFICGVGCLPSIGTCTTQSTKSQCRSTNESIISCGKLCHQMRVGGIPVCAAHKILVHEFIFPLQLKMDDAFSTFHTLTVEAVVGDNSLEYMQVKMYDNSTEWILNDPAKDSKTKKITNISQLLPVCSLRKTGIGFLGEYHLTLTSTSKARHSSESRVFLVSPLFQQTVKPKRIPATDSDIIMLSPSTGIF